MKNLACSALALAMLATVGAFATDEAPEAEPVAGEEAAAPRADGPPPEPFPLTNDELKRWGRSEIVFIGMLDKAVAGPTGMSMPPLHTATLQATVETPLRGAIKPEQKVEIHHSVRQQKPPEFPVGELCVIAASNVRGSAVLDFIEPATDEMAAKVELACAVPAGWSVEDGKLVCPWAGLGDAAWPADAELPEDAMPAPGLACARTGRPALRAGHGVKFEVEPAPPQKEIKWTNPDGDGEYVLTVTNPGEEPLAVPGLLTAGDEILWDECLLILCQDKVYTIPGCEGVAAAAGEAELEPLVLEPEQSVSTTVNALALDGPEWPRGGYRIEFQFCLGEKAVRRSFYYKSDHHDRIRERARAED